MQQQPQTQAGSRWALVGAVFAVISLGAVAALADSYPIAGVDPAKRPAGAPVITEFQKDAVWYRQALTGISEPYPGSLRFLEDEGAWYTPFILPGMPPPYDIRGWHDRTSPGAGELAQ